MPQDDGQVADARDSSSNPGLMLGVERAEIAGDCDSIDLVFDLVDFGQDGWQVERFFLGAVKIVSP